MITDYGGFDVQLDVYTWNICISERMKATTVRTRQLELSEVQE